MGTDRYSNGDYLNQPPLTAEQVAQRELDHARWHAAAMLERVNKAAKASADAAARVAQLEAAMAHAEAARLAVAMQNARAQSAQLPVQQD